MRRKVKRERELAKMDEANSLPPRKRAKFSE